MWKCIFIGATLWSALADSSENAAASSKSKFPVQLIAATGDPKPGEGLGGVAVLLKPMPEATTMKTWSFLKESMLKIGDQVKQILNVRNDMASLQGDLTKQEKAWHQAEIKLNQENAALRAEVEALKRKVQAGSVVQGELIQTKQSLAEEKRRAADLANAAEMDNKKFKTELAYLNTRRDNVTALQKQVNETASIEISKAQAVSLQLLKDQVTLRLAAQNFDDQNKIKQERMDFEKAKAAAKKAELTRQITAMNEGLIRIKGKLKPTSAFSVEESALKAKLQTETSNILLLQAQQQTIVTQCMKEMQEKETIKCSEEAKLKSRTAEKTQFCNAILVQKQVLVQDLSKCTLAEQLAGGTAVAAPAGTMMQEAVPVLVGDTEMNMQAPAPAPMA